MISMKLKDGFRQTRALIDLPAIEHNLIQIRNHVGENTEILAVVKADAYGHGAVQVARVCERSGAAILGVAFVEEGAVLRSSGIKLPILAQCCATEEEMEAALKNEITLTATSYEFANRLSEKALRADTVARVHADIDTGMGRIGFAANAASDEISRIAELPGIDVEGIYTHFATSEIENDPFTREQLRRFGQIIDALNERGVKPRRVHAANSGAVINFREAHLTLVRPGLILYGVYPHESLRRKLDLKPALRFETAIVFLKDVPKGTSLGYGRSFVAPRKMRIATANVGYADGYPWRLSNRSKVIVRGKLVPTVGRVSMDQLLIDVSSVPGINVGDMVTLLGSDGNAHITAEEMAAWAGTIPYEILCGISKRVPRQYLQGSLTGD